MQHHVYVARELEITPALEQFFVRDPAIRGGDCTLRGTRLTPDDVLSIVANDEQASYPYITAAQIAACQALVHQ
jgi:uncharacterized protein (DUF433 family)